MDPISQEQFLLQVPPGKTVLVSNFVKGDQRSEWTINIPEIGMHCPECDGTRVFFSQNDPISMPTRGKDTFLYYLCRNCCKSKKKFAISASFDKPTGSWEVLKHGEDPPFGPPTHARAMTLIGPDRDQFLMGRRCENQGLGVGAFVYYRRVVENQKNRIFDEIIRVSKHLTSDVELITDLIIDLETAKNETQFTKSVDAIKHSLPQSILVNGHNPLILLHSALSKGVHELNDSECLELATSVRRVLVEFAIRLSEAMKDEAELNEAVNKLARRNGK